MWVNFPPSTKALVVVLFGIILYAVLNGRRMPAGRNPQLVHNPPDGTAAQAPAPTLTRSG
jgi:hypothetical protein